MKKANLWMGALFIGTAVLGSLLAGSGAGAQSVAPVLCSASIYTIAPGQSLTLNATGGNGNYVWSSPGLVINNPTGSSFMVAFNAPGIYPVTVASAGASSTCTVTVMNAIVVPTTPGLPNTGELPE